MIRVLVADDSAFMRHTMAKLLAADPEITVVDTARDGVDALAKLQRYRPDVVTLDVEMPRMDGLTTLGTIMAESPVPVIMVSALTSDGSETTIRALELGAFDFVAKPSGSISLDIHTVAETLIAKVKQAAAADPGRLLRGRMTLLARQRMAQARAALEPRPDVITSPTDPTNVSHGAPADVRRIAAVDRAPQPNASSVTPVVAKHILAIGSSTGGPAALCRVAPRIPAGLNIAILIVQHMPPVFTQSLANRLDQLSPMVVKEAEAGDKLYAGQVLVAPGDYHVTVDAEGAIALNQGPRMHGVRPAVDIAWESLARHFGNRVTAAILTGMGSDGASGALQIRRAGGRVVAQDEESCVVYGMPRAAVEKGAVDRVVSLDAIADALLELAGLRVPALPLAG